MFLVFPTTFNIFSPFTSTATPCIGRFSPSTLHIQCNVLIYLYMPVYPFHTVLFHERKTVNWTRHICIRSSRARLLWNFWESTLERYKLLYRIGDRVVTLENYREEKIGNFSIAKNNFHWGLLWLNSQQIQQEHNMSTKFLQSSKNRELIKLFLFIIIISGICFLTFLNGLDQTPSPSL